MIVGLRIVVRMVMVMDTVFALVIMVMSLRVFPMGMIVNVFVGMAMIVGVPVFVGVQFVTVAMLVAVFMLMFVGMLVFMLVCALHRKYLPFRNGNPSIGIYYFIIGLPGNPVKG